MPEVEILVSVLSSIHTPLVGPHVPPEVGDRGAFSDDLVLERYGNKTPGHGLPQDQQQRLAGTQSGFVTTVRVAAAGDRFFPPGTEIMEYEGTYRLNAVPNSPLEKGQITARGIFAAGPAGIFEPPPTFAITGGTGPYNRVRGEIREGNPTADSRLLDIKP